MSLFYKVTLDAPTRYFLRYKSAKKYCETIEQSVGFYGWSLLRGWIGYFIRISMSHCTVADCNNWDIFANIPNRKSVLIWWGSKGCHKKEINNLIEN